MAVPTQAPTQSLPSILNHAAELTARNSQEGAPAAPVPLIAAQSPLHELLIQEIAAILPSPVAQKLREARSIDAVHDWIAAGTLWRWIQNDRLAADQFLEDLANNPRTAGLALATSVARSLPPVPPYRRAPVLDRVGVCCECIAAGVLLALRGAAMTLLVALGSGSDWSSQFLSRTAIGSAWPVMLWHQSPTLNRWAGLAIGGAMLLILVELLFVPILLEAIRHLPSRFHRTTPLPAWRVDPLLLSWVIQAGVALIGLIYGEFRFANAIWHLRSEEPVLVGMSRLLAVLGGIVVPRAMLKAWKSIARTLTQLP